MDASVVVDVGSRRRTAARTRVVGTKILRRLILTLVVGVSSALLLLTTKQVNAFPFLAQQQRNRRRIKARSCRTKLLSTKAIRLSKKLLSR